MFGIGGWESLIILIIVIIMIKPDNLPAFVHKVGKIFGKLRKSYDLLMGNLRNLESQFKEQMNDVSGTSSSKTTYTSDKDYDDEYDEEDYNDEYDDDYQEEDNKPRKRKSSSKKKPSNKKKSGTAGKTTVKRKKPGNSKKMVSENKINKSIIKSVKSKTQNKKRNK